jgi:hypothetical protein
MLCCTLGVSDDAVDELSLELSAISEPRRGSKSMATTITGRLTAALDQGNNWQHLPATFFSNARQQY